MLYSSNKHANFRSNIFFDCAITEKSGETDNVTILNVAFEMNISYTSTNRKQF